MKSVFKPSDVEEIIGRINQLTPDTGRLWGTMTPAQMLAHCNVAYEMTYGDEHKRPNFFIRLMMKLFVKNVVVGAKPYPKNNQTAPQFVIKEKRDFGMEKQRMLAYIQKTLDFGESHFEQKENLSFGKLSAQEWNILFYKHLDHHLRQFGV